MLQLKNRFILAAVKLGYAHKDGRVNDRHIRFYRQRSSHTAAVILEPLYLHSSLREIPTQLGIDEDDKIAGLRNLTDTIRAAGAQTVAHLNHPGRMANPNIPGNDWISSTDVPCENSGATPRAMTEEEMTQVCTLFADAARRAQRAGIDILELQMGHGYLLAQFLSPAVNTRTDAYGGSFANRVRFPLRVLETIRQAVSLPIIVRLSAQEMIPGGITLEESIALVRLLEEQGAAAVHVSAGSVCSTPPWYFQHMFIPKGKTWEWAARIKRHTSLPVIAVGQINAKEDLRALDPTQADYIAVGRALVADPDFIGKLTGEIPDPIRPCMACADGCLGGVKSGKGLGCVVNPHVSDTPPVQQPLPDTKRYAVIGGGLAGMEAALTLEARGAQVDLYEPQPLGGQFTLASLPPGKHSLTRIVNYYRERLRASHVTLLQQEATAEAIIGHYDAAILATGSRPFVPPIEGLKDFSWAESLEDPSLTGQHVLIVGGGMIGIEIASKLVDQDNRITIVEMLDEIARGMEMIERTLTLKKLASHSVTILTGYKVTEIRGSRVRIAGAEEREITKVDHIVIATGMQSYHPLKTALEGHLPVVCAGDAKTVGKAQDAIRDGQAAAAAL